MKLRKKKKNQKQQRNPNTDQSHVAKNQYFRSSDSALKRQRLSRETSSTSRLSNPKHTPKLQNNNKLAQFSSVISLLIFIGIFSLLLSASSVNPNGSKVVISQDSFQFREPQEYETFIDNYVSSHLLTRSKLFFPITDFNTAFVKQYPEITEIKTKVPFADRTIEVTIKTPEPIFRIAGSETENNKGYKYIDASGSVVESSLQNTRNIPHLRIDSSSLSEVGTQLLTQNEVEILKLVDAEIISDTTIDLPKNFSISSADLDIKNGRLEVGFNQVPYIVRFSTYNDARNQVGALKATLQELYKDGGGQPPNEYIDVRVYEKVFIK